MTENKKFILLHVGVNEAQEVMTDAIKNQGVERGLVFKNNLGVAIMNQFSYIAERGYFPVGIIVDTESNTIEFMFKRHPSQTEEQKLNEIEIKSPEKP